VTLERGGRSFRLALGENKPERGARGGQGSGTTSTAPVVLPANLQGLVSRLLPPGGAIRVRMVTDNGQPAYHVDTKVNGLDHEVRLATDGTVLRRESEMRHEDVPQHVAAAANNIPGYRVNPDNPPTHFERNGQRYFQLEMIPADGGKKIDVNIAPDGTVLGRE